MNHRAVARQVRSESEITAGYFLLLTLANLIALSGLLANSVPAIIGAMLISPLMGPILSFGFAFITGDTGVLRRSFRKIGLSIALTLAVAAAASFLSPLQIATPEILARTTPNLFDLFIAVFAGIAGAIALCTKRSILTIVPGVAIATAVIPPLSVAGYGLGTGQWAISWGGFYLFFTNFVAITLVTCAVFLTYGFEPGEGTGAAPNTIRNRMVALTAALALVSVPLVLTLRSSILEVKDRRAIRNVLQEALNREKRSNLAAFSHKLLEGGAVAVSAVVNTTEYLSQEEVRRAEVELGETLGRPATLYLEQVKTFPGGAAPAPAPPARLRPPGEILAEARRESEAALRKGVSRLSTLLAPSAISRASIEFGPDEPPTTVRLSLRRDLPFGQEERRWVERLLSDELQLPLRVEVELMPLMAPLEFLPGETGLTAVHDAQLLEAGRLYAEGAGALLQVEASAESRKAAMDARRRLDAAIRYLTESCGIPAERLRPSVSVRTSEPRVSLRFLPSPEGGSGGKGGGGA